MPDPVFTVTDIQGSTALWERLGPAFAPVLAVHNRIVRETIVACGGKEVRTEGDSFTAAFPSAAAGLQFSLALLGALHRHPWPPETGEIVVRVGVHSAPTPALAAAVSGAAHGGQILATAETVEAGRGALTDASLLDLGEHRFAGAPGPVRLFQVLPRELSGRVFPPPRTESALLTNLLREKNAFVGRDAELRELAALIPMPAGRLITLTGPGGIGKSRLATRAAATLLPQFPGGAWIADISEARSAADVGRAVAAALGIPLAGRDDPPKAVAAALEFRKPLLLILDSFEGATAHAGSTVALWSRAARDSRFVVTSRILLHLSGEREISLGPLPVPTRMSHESGIRRNPSKNIGSFDAVRLFTTRAAEQSPGFVLDAGNERVIAQICSRLEGIPLALELAASRLRDASPEKVLEQLSARIVPLEPSATESASRRQTLSGALAWTYEELADWERSAFRQVCSFRSGFYLEAAEAVVDLSAFDEAALAIDAVQGLRDRSLVRTWDTPFGTRFGMYGPVREFGESRAADATPGESEGACGRHAAFFGTYSDTWRRELAGPAGAEGLRRLTLEEENLLRAAEWGRGRPDMAAREAGARALMAWTEVATNRGPYTEVRPACEATIRGLPAPSEIRVNLQLGASRAEFYTGAMPGCVDLAERGLQEARLLGDPKVLVKALGWAGRVFTVKGDIARALSLFNEGEAIARPAGDLLGLCNIVGMRGTVHHELRDIPLMDRDFSEAVRLARETGNRLGLARHLTNYGTVHRVRGEFDAALAVYDEAESIFREIGNIADIGAVASNRGIIRYELGDAGGARECFADAADSYRFVGNVQQLALTLSNLAALCCAENEIKRGLPYADEAVRVARELNLPHSILACLNTRSSLLRNDGRPIEALADAEEGIALARKMNLRRDLPAYFTSAAACLIALGRLEEARKLVEEGIQIADLPVEQAFERFDLGTHLALIEEACGRPAEARRAAEEAVRLAALVPKAQARRLKDEPGLLRAAERIAAGLPPA